MDFMTSGSDAQGKPGAVYDEIFLESSPILNNISYLTFLAPVQQARHGIK